MRRTDLLSKSAMMLLHALNCVADLAVWSPEIFFLDFEQLNTVHFCFEIYYKMLTFGNNKIICSFLGHFVILRQRKYT